jgi:vacuolar-type H+-ATPase subunit F/Vma7
MSGKTSPLEKILEIDMEIIQIKNDTTYMKIRNGLKKIKSRQHGNSFVTIPSPRDENKEIKIRRRSKEMKSVIKMYENRLSVFEEKIISLFREKNALEMQIFG